MIRYLLAVFFMVSISFLHAQTSKENSISLTGNFTQDSKILAMNTTPIQKNTLLPEQQAGKKNPMLAGLFSLIIPGSGQFYSEHYIEAGVFAAIEVGAVVIGLHYNTKGDNQTNFFQGVGDNEWSVVRYAQWLNAKNANSPDLQITIDANESKPTWERVNWQQVNNAELGSHKLPVHGTQQFYELIGKYNEYNPGWDDYSGATIEDPVVSGQSTQPTAHLKTYAGYRGKANDYYDYASHAVIAIYINHFLSVVDAIWDAISFNKDLKLKSNVESQMINGKSEYVSTMTMSLAF
jgi:hypothetical protein